MRMIWEMTWKSLWSKKLLTVLILLMLVAGEFLAIGSVSYALHSTQRVDDFYLAYPEDEYRFYAECPVAPDAMKLYGSPTSTLQTADYINYVRAMRAAGDFTFYTFRDSHLRLLDLKVGDACLTGYQEFYSSRDILYVEEYDAWLSNAQAYCIDPAVIAEFRLPLAEGTDFADFDSSDCNHEVIPIVAGWSYREFYKLGDRIIGSEPLEFTRYITYEIVGFLEPGASILPPEEYNSEKILSLDNYLLYPVTDYTGLPIPAEVDRSDPDLSVYEKMAAALYLDRVMDLCTGVVISEDAQYSLKDIAAEFGFGILFPHRTMRIPDSFNESADRYFELLLLAAILIMAGSALCLAFNLANKLLASFKTYAVHLISGATLGGIRGFMVAETALIVVSANLLALLCAALFGRGIFSYSVSAGVGGIQVAQINPIAELCALGMSLAVGLFALLFPLIKTGMAEYDTLLRGRE